jgi:hypothetical protein
MMFRRLHNWWIRRQINKVEVQMDNLLIVGSILLPDKKNEYNQLEEKLFLLEKKKY